VSDRIALADAAALTRQARRTALVGAVLALLLIAAVVAVALSSATPTAKERRFVPSDSNGIVVLDLSASISSDTFARIGAALRELSSGQGRYGLVLFSDVAYEALPPGTPAAALKPLVRYFTLPRQTTPGFAPAFPTSPWTQSFSAGTRISSGLGMALRLIQTQHLKRASVILVSDLDDDPGDLTSLGAAALALKSEHVPVRVVALNPAPRDEQLFQRLLNRASAVTHAPLPGERPVTIGPTIPLTPAILAVLAAVVLAAAALFGARLRWRTA
jgi:hypothetical protein